MGEKEGLGREGDWPRQEKERKDASPKKVQDREHILYVGAGEIEAPRELPDWVWDSKGGIQILVSNKYKVIWLSTGLTRYFSDKFLWN